MKKKLVLLTSAYPYGEKETFITSELDLLTEEFEVFIFPTVFSKRNSIPRLTNPNIQILNLGSARHLNLLVSLYPIFIFKKGVFNQIKNRISHGDPIFKTIQNVLGYYRRSLYISQLIRKRFQHVLRESPKELILYSYWFLESAYASSMVNRKYGCSAFTRAHRVDLYEGVSKYPILFRQECIYHLSGVFPISLDGVRYLRERYSGFNALKCFYLGTTDRGVNDSITRIPFVIVSCARAVSVKRLHLIAQALLMIENRDIQWIHFGGGEELDRLQAVASTFSPNISAVFYGDTEHDFILDFYSNNNIDLFINSSYSEGVPVSIMEAISFGIPVIATNVGGTSEIVIDGINGKLLDRDFEIDVLANLIVYFMDVDEKEYRRYRFESRKIWEDNFSTVNNTKKFIQEIIYESSKREETN